MEEAMEVELPKTTHRSHRRKNLTSEFFAAEALATDMDVPVEYIVGQTDKSIDDWLQENKPSQLSNRVAEGIYSGDFGLLHTLQKPCVRYRNHHCSYVPTGVYDGIGWIWVRKYGDEKKDDDKKDEDFNTDEEEDDYIGDGDGPDVLKLQESWEMLQSSGRQITFNSISDLAKMYKITSGKWLFHVDTGFKADHLWGIVARGIANGEITSKIAKISPNDPDEEDHTHVVCVYNENYLDYEQVLNLENGLRKIGIKCPLYYKPDVFTFLGIYRNNPWELRPTIYSSNYNVLTGTSLVKAN